jgi:hypothetical protein
MTIPAAPSDAAPERGGDRKHSVNLSTREWVLAISIVVLLQYVLTAWVNHFGSDTTVVSHVSFAGTLISIILAVLAIIYTYYQNFAQQRDSDSLALQIASMHQVLEEIRESGSTFGGLADRFAEIREKIDRSVSLTEQSREDVRGMRAKMEQQSQQAQSSGSTPTAALTDAQALRFARTSSINGLFAIYALRIAFDHEVAEVSLQQLAGAISSAKDAYLYGYIIAASSAGILELSSRTGDMIKAKTIHSALTAIVIRSQLEESIAKLYKDAERKAQVLGEIVLVEKVARGPVTEVEA